MNGNDRWTMYQVDSLRQNSVSAVPLWFTILGLVLLLTLAACGSGGGGGDAPPELGTLAYVNTTCRDDPTGFTLTQELRVRRGDAAPITVARFGIASRAR